MKKSLFFAIVGFVAAVCLPISSATADQWAIAVPDPSFDDHVLNNVGDYMYIGDPGYTGAWKSDLPNGAYIDYRYWLGDGDLPARSGNLKAYASDAATFDYIYQILDETFIEGGTYTLSVWVGNAWPEQGYADGWGLYFTGEDYKINLIEAHGLALLGDWEQVSLAYTATADDDGKKIGIKMSGAQGESYIAFEDVTLSYDGPRNPRATMPIPADGAEHDDVRVTLSWTAGATAVKHDVYFGTDFDDVKDATASEPPVDPYKGRQTDASYEVNDLVPGTTYYWRIDEVEADGTTIHKGHVWSFWLTPLEAYNPSPADGARFIVLDANLSWSPGLGAVTHDVYFGTNQTAVADGTGGTFKGNQPLTTYDPGTLELEKVYYWRVDELDGSATHKGNVWRFTTVPFIPISDPYLVGWWTFDEGAGNTAVDWSGHGNHGTLTGGPLWISGQPGYGGAIQFDGAADYVDIGYNSMLSINEFTVSAWVKIAAEPGTFGVLGTRVGGDDTFDFKVQADNIHGDIGSGSDWIDTAIDIRSGDTGTNGQGGDLAVDTWYMITYVIDNTNQQVRLYLDADLKRTITISGTPLLMKAGQSMRIGDTGYSEWMNGQLDDVRLYNKALSTAELRLIGGFLAAYDPIPADEASGVSAATTIDWLAGPLAASHNVYFGTNYADVKAGTGGTFKGNQPLADHDYDPPGALEAGKVYYWKIDEVNDLHLDKKWEGPVWVFRVAGGAGGLLGAYYHHTGGNAPAGFETFILSRIDPEINWDWGDGSPDALVNVNQFSCRWTGQVEAPFSEDYIFYPATDDGVHLWVDGQLVVDEWWDRPTTEGDSPPIALVAGQKYDIVMEQYENGGGASAYLRWSSPSTPKRIIPSIWLWPPTKASSPVPPDGSTGAPSQQPTLSWVAGVYAAAANGHKVYFDADEQKVIKRHDCQVNGVSTTNPSYPLLPTFGLEETYYWAVDEVNNLHPDHEWRGDTWSFTTTNNKFVDDFETYEDAGPVPEDINWIYFVYTDGFGDLDCTAGTGNGSGAKIALQRPGQGGSSLAMLFQYDNDGMVKTPSACDPFETEVVRAHYSKAEALVAKLPSGIGSDWTVGGAAKALSLWFYGDPLNSIEPMWVQLTDAANNKAKVLYGTYADEDVKDVNEASWHEWLIDLEDFNVPPTPVNIKNVKSIAIGIGTEGGPGGGSGTLYFDDIRLYTPRCVLARREADFAIVDYVQDCVVDYKEFEIMAENWLGAVRVPITVPDAGFDAHELTFGDYIYISDAAYTGAWKPDVVEGAYVDYGYWSADGDLPARSGNNKIYGGDVPDYIYQILDETFVEGKTYTLSVWVGQPWTGYGRAWSLYFTGEDYKNNLIEASGAAPNTWRQVSLVYTATAADAGKNIGIKMKGDEYVAFDDVTLFVSSESLTGDPRVNLYEDIRIDFKDFAVLGGRFLDEEMFP